MKKNSFICVKTGEEYALSEPRWQSDQQGLLDIRFRPSFDIYRIRQRSANLWRYREAIPIQDDANIVSFGEGATPLQQIDLDNFKIHLKLDFLFPTGSYKDRGASVMISKVKELGIDKVVQDSSGNAGASVAAYCAKAGIACDIYAPKRTSQAKLTQIKMYGATLHLIDGTREDTAQAALEAAQKSYYASHCWNPYFFQGTKTFAFEIAEQMGWKAPDTVILPAGNGTLLIGAYIGFRELMRAGITTQIPKIIGVQAANCSPLYEAFNQDLPAIPEITTQPSIAEGIAIKTPVRGLQMIHYVELTSGKFLVVEESEIKDTLFLLGKQGFFVEPTSAAVIAGVRQYLQQEAHSAETIVSVLTGAGLKATNSIQKLLEDA